METLNIVLPESVRSFVQQRIAEGRYQDVSEYIQELIRADQSRQANVRLESELIQGLASGTPIEMTPEDWERRKRSLAERLGRPNSV